MVKWSGFREGETILLKLKVAEANLYTSPLNAVKKGVQINFRTLYGI